MTTRQSPFPISVAAVESLLPIFEHLQTTWEREDGEMLDAFSQLSSEDRCNEPETLARVRATRMRYCADLLEEAVRYRALVDLVREFLRFSHLQDRDDGGIELCDRAEELLRQIEGRPS